MPRAYVLSDVTLKNADAVTAYRVLAARSIAAFGGRYIVRGGAIEVFEGSWQPSAIVIVEFPDAAAARAWYSSPQYAKALALRDAALTRNLLLVEGADEEPDLA